MATRSTIAIQNSDGTVTGIYCHWDGYLSNNGKILQEKYITEETVRKLIALGDLSSLGDTIGVQVDFNDSDSHYGQCVAYGRDRGEQDVDAKTCESWDRFVDDFGQEYNYVFVPGVGWKVKFFDNWDSKEMSLVEALAMEAEN